MSKLTRHEQRILADYDVCYPFDPQDMARILTKVDHARDIAENGWVEPGVDPLECLQNIAKLLRPETTRAAEILEAAPVTAFGTGEERETRGGDDAAPKR